MKKMMLVKMGINASLCSSAFLPSLLICSSCQKQDNSQYKIDGTNWKGRIVGSFSQYDYNIDNNKKEITYFCAVSFHTHDLVIPNYIFYNNEYYKVKIGASCFANNMGIAGTVELNDFIDEIPERCFYGCTSLQGIVCHKYLKKVEKLSFAECPIFVKIVVLLDDRIDNNWTLELTSIGAFAFFGCELKGDLFLGSNFNFLGEYAFSRCFALNKVDLSFCDELKKVPKGVFSGCNTLLEVDLPKNIEEFGESSFVNCYNLTTVDTSKFTHDYVELSNQCFAGCSSLESFTKMFKTHAIGTQAFDGCSKLNIDFSTEDTGFDKTIYNNAFVSCDIAAFKFTKKVIVDVYDNAFNSCKNLQYLNFVDYENEPPAWTGLNIFGEISEEGTIYLKEGADYQKWTNFFLIQGIDLLNSNWNIVYE